MSYGNVNPMIFLKAILFQICIEIHSKNHDNYDKTKTTIHINLVHRP